MSFQELTRAFPVGTHVRVVNGAEFTGCTGMVAAIIGEGTRYESNRVELNPSDVAYAATNGMSLNDWSFSPDELAPLDDMERR